MAKANQVIEAIVDSQALLYATLAATALEADCIRIQGNPDESGVMLWFQAGNPVCPSVPLSVITCANGVSGARTMQLGIEACEGLTQLNPDTLGEQVKVVLNLSEGVLLLQQADTGATLFEHAVGSSTINDAAIQTYGTQKPPGSCHIIGNMLVYNMKLEAEGSLVNVSAHLPDIGHAPLLRRHLVEKAVFALKPVTEEQEQTWLNHVRSTQGGQVAAPPPPVLLPAQAGQAPVNAPAPSAAEPAAKTPRKRTPKPEAEQAAQGPLDNCKLPAVAFALADGQPAALHADSVALALPATTPSVAPQTNNTPAAPTTPVAAPAAIPQVPVTPAPTAIPTTPVPTETAPTEEAGEKPSKTRKPRGSNNAAQLEQAKTLLEAAGYKVIPPGAQPSPLDLLEQLRTCLEGLAEKQQQDLQEARKAWAAELASKLTTLL